jgi:hypothetical protein
MTTTSVVGAARRVEIASGRVRGPRGCAGERWALAVPVQPRAVGLRMVVIARGELLPNRDVSGRRRIPRVSTSLVPRLEDSP